MIECNEAINFGTPALKGRRLTVFDIVTMVLYSDTVQEALEDYRISWQDAMDATVYCVNLRCQSDKTRVQYCDGCLLRTFDEGWHFDKTNFKEYKGDDNIVISKEQDIMFIGSLQELEDSEFGRVTWLNAIDVHKKLMESKT